MTSVLLSPDEYVRLMNEVNYAHLLTITSDRMAHYNPDTVISYDEMNRRLCITDKNLAGYNEVKFE